MTARDHVMQRLRLRTHPFAPEIAKDGSAFGADPFSAALNPVNDQRLLAYYFDVYDWRSSPALKGVSPSGLQKFPERDDLSEDGPLLIVVSGTGRSGRGSLVNLILHKIEVARRMKPIVVRANFNGSDPSQNVKQLATSFIFKYSAADTNEPQPTRDQLQAIFDRETRTKVVDGQAYYSSLFVGLGTDVRARCQRPIVFCISGGDRYDLWSCLYHSSKPLSDYLIVQTPKVADANTCYTLMTVNGNNVVHIDAAKLDRNKARAYIAARLDAERTVPVPAGEALAPFTPAAIEILFKPANEKAASETKKTVTQAIGWLRKTLSRVLQEHIDELAAKVNAAGPNVLDAMSENELFVSENAMWDIRQQMNKG